MLSDELVIDLAGLDPNRKVCASTCMTRKFDKKPCECYPGMRAAEALEFARAIEAEVHKQYTDLIRQMLGALEESSPYVTVAHEWKSSEWIAKRAHAITAARARLGENR